MMEFGEEDVVLEAVSPSSEYLRSSTLSLTILGVLEFQIPIDDSLTIPLLNHLFLPINPRFSSLMVVDKKGTKRWKPVTVNLKDHVKVPIFPEKTPPESYDDHFNNYITKISMDELPQNRPLWEVHIIKYPTSNAAGNVVFKLHHALGDGYSLMGALLSCLQRADDPSLPLTFPSRASISRGDGRNGTFKRIPRFLYGIMNTAFDFGWSLLKSTVLEDDESPIRSGEKGVEYRPIAVVMTAFSLDSIKRIKTKLNVTINDVITGVVTLGTRLYMRSVRHESGRAKTTTLVLLNTRNIAGYESIGEMVKPNSKTPWGNHFAFLHVSIPKLPDDTGEKPINPLQFVQKTHRIIKKKRNSMGVFLTGRMLEIMRKLRGAETTAEYIYGTLKNSSMTISNVIGPTEQMSLANHPVKGIYFAVTGAPQSLSITMVSYMGKLRVSIGVEKDFIDPHQLKSCIENAFQMMLEAALDL